MQFDPERIAAIQTQLETMRSLSMSEAFTALAKLGYSSSEMRQGFNCWVAKQYSATA